MVLGVDLISFVLGDWKPLAHSKCSTNTCGMEEGDFHQPKRSILVSEQRDDSENPRDIENESMSGVRNTLK